eukprot:m.354600 g.354600  ORF g.354600 m.354600 type:complete len:539 (-) comp55934_c0_seq7:148-1764(-)
MHLQAKTSTQTRASGSSLLTPFSRCSDESLLALKKWSISLLETLGEEFFEFASGQPGIVLPRSCAGGGPDASWTCPTAKMSAFRASLQADSHSTRFMALYVWCLASMGHQIGPLLKVFDKYNQLKLAPHEAVFNTVITACGRNGRTNHAFALYQDMRKRGVQPTPVTYICLFNACMQGTELRLDKATELFESIKEKQVEVPIAVINAYFKVLVRSPRAADVFKHFEEYNELLESQGVTLTRSRTKPRARERLPDMVTYSLLIQASRTAQSFEQLLKHFDLAINSSTDLDSQFFTEVLASTCELAWRTRLPTQQVRTLMQDCQVELTKRRLPQTLALLDALASLHARLGCSRKDRDELVQHLEALAIKPDARLQASLTLATASFANLAEYKAFVDQLPAKGVVGTANLQLAIAKGFLRVCDVAETVRQLRAMQAAGSLQLDAAIVLTLLKTAATQQPRDLPRSPASKRKVLSGRMEVVHAVLDWMKEAGIQQKAAVLDILHQLAQRSPSLVPPLAARAAELFPEQSAAQHESLFRSARP